MAKKKAAAAATPAEKKPPTKGELYAQIAETTGLSRRQVSDVFTALNDAIAQNLKPRGPQAFTIPGLAKLTIKKKPATKARKGINPFTGEETTFKAKPASKVVKIRPLKNLKEMV